MTALAGRSMRLTQAGVLAVSSAGVAALIVLGETAEMQKLWVAALLTVGLCLAAWAAARSGLFTLGQLDRWAWALLLSHTVFTSRVRDPRDILSSNAPTADIALEIAIWVLIFTYAASRLAFDLRMLRGLATPTARLALLFFVVASASAVYAANPLITMAWSFKLLTTITMALVLAFSEGQLEPVERFASASYTGLYLMLVQFGIMGLMSPSAALDWSAETEILRLGGYILPATQLSAVGGMVLTLAVIDMLSGKRNRFTLPVMAVSGLTMLATLGRSGMIATLLALGFAFVHYGRTSRFLLLAVIAGLLLLTVPGLTDTAWDLATRKQTADQIGSLTGRVQLWETAVDLIRERPLLGWGYVSGSRVAFLTAFRWWPAIHTHNALLEILLTLGIVGAVVLLSLLVLTFASVFRALRHTVSSAARSVRRDCLAKILALMILIAADGMLTSGVGGAPRFEAVILIGASLCIGAVRLSPLRA